MLSRAAIGSLPPVMPRRYLRQILPAREVIGRQPLPAALAGLLDDGRLWHFGRRTVTRGAALGMFIAFLPVPFQMILVVMAAVWLRVNLPVAFTAILVTNPVTMGPVFYLTYRLGAWLLGMPVMDRPAELTLHWFVDLLGYIWLPLYVGSLVTGVLAGVTVLLLTGQLWKYAVLLKRRSRRYT